MQRVNNRVTVTVTVSAQGLLHGTASVSVAVVM
jgi:hypothetical protein